jgi:hypothetical protein
MHTTLTHSARLSAATLTWYIGSLVSGGGLTATKWLWGNQLPVLILILILDTCAKYCKRTKVGEKKVSIELNHIFTKCLQLTVPQGDHPALGSLSGTAQR